MTSTRFFISAPELLHRGADVVRIDPLADLGLARSLQEHEADAVGSALLVERRRRQNRPDVDRRIQAGGQAVPIQQVADLVAKLDRAREAKRGEQAKPHRLPMAIALVAARGLDRMT